MSQVKSGAPPRNLEESVARAAEIVRRYGHKEAADRAVGLLGATFRTGTVVVVGEVKRGKSSLINALIRQRDLLPVDALTCTSAPIRISITDAAPTIAKVELLRGKDREVIPASELARWVTAEGTKKAEGTKNNSTADALELPRAAEITVQVAELNGVTVVDTPGVGGLDDRAVHAALTEARHAGVLLMVCDASTPITAPEMEILRSAKESVGGVIVAVTKTDKNTRRWRSIVEDNRRLITKHLGIDVPVIGVSSLRALDAAETLDPTRRVELENRCGIAQLRSMIRMELKQPANIGQRAALQSVKTALNLIAAEVEEDISVLNQSSAGVAELEAERANIERLREESAEFEQRFQRDLTVGRNQVIDQLDRFLEELKQDWTQYINSEPLRVLRSKPQVFTSQIEVDVSAVMADTVASLVKEISTIAKNLFPDSPEVIEEIVQAAVSSLAAPQMEGRDVEKKTKDIVDPSVLMMGMIGAGALASIIPVAPLAGAVWIGVNLGYRAMRNGKQHLITWLRETIASARLATTRMLDTVITTARTELMLRYRSELRRKMKQLQVRIDQVRQVAVESEEQRKERITRFQRNLDIIKATVQELDGHTTAVMV